jgi:uncharacterized protein
MDPANKSREDVEQQGRGEGPNLNYDYHEIMLYLQSNLEEFDIMLLSQDHNHGDYEIHSYEAGKLKINDNYYEHSVIVSTHELILWEPQTFEQLAASSFEKILELQPAVVLLGTGEKMVLPNPKLMAPFYESKIGIEVMSTLAACRTFNVLMSEDRQVVAALLIR